MSVASGRIDRRKTCPHRDTHSLLRLQRNEASIELSFFRRTGELLPHRGQFASSKIKRGSIVGSMVLKSGHASA